MILMISCCARPQGMTRAGCQESDARFERSQFSRDRTGALRKDHENVSRILKQLLAEAQALAKVDLPIEIAMMGTLGWTGTALRR